MWYVLSSTSLILKNSVFSASEFENLSYSIKSSVTYKDQQAPVESLVHTSGLKNFADTGISSSVSAGLFKTCVFT